MIRMTVALWFALGCSMKPAEDKGATPGKSGAMAPTASMGSAMGTIMMDAAAPVIGDAAPPNPAPADGDAGTPGLDAVPDER